MSRLPASRTIALAAGFDRSLVNFRGALIQAMLDRGHRVLTIAPEQTPGVRRQLESWGARFMPVRLARAGTNPFADWVSYSDYRKIFLAERPDVLLAYTIKPVIYATLAAYRAGVPHRYVLITGLGAAFHTPGLKGRLLSSIASRFYRRSFSRSTRIIGQNRDILRFFRDRGIISATANTAIVPGSGVDTTAFAAKPFPSGGPPRFLMLSRLLKDKGVEEYAAAARMVRERMPESRFILAGDLDPNPAGVGASQLQAWTRSGLIEHRPAVADVRPLLEECHAYVLPSYHEGMPRSNLEAMAVARPLITTDAIGCRETVFDLENRPFGPHGSRRGRNGFLVPTHSAEALAEAMQFVIDRPLDAAEMGRAGRLLAEKHFDVRRINELMFQAMDLLPDRVGNLFPAISS